MLDEGEVRWAHARGDVLQMGSNRRIFRVTSTIVAAVVLVSVVVAHVFNSGSVVRNRPIVSAISSLHWQYQGHDGPMHWGDDFYTCSTGTEQSPIDIPTGLAKPLEMWPLKWEVPQETLNLHQRKDTFNSHCFDLTDDEKPSMQMWPAGPRYVLQQIQMHAPSENAIDGKHFDLEIQFHHMAPGPQYMVISAMFERNVTSDSPHFVDQMSQNLQSAVYKYAPLNPAIDFASVLSTLQKKESGIENFLRFNGSLTTPPCSEWVLWNVITDPIPFNYFDSDEIFQDIPTNSRPLQPLNGRDIYYPVPYKEADGVTDWWFEWGEPGNDNPFDTAWINAAAREEAEGEGGAKEGEGEGGEGEGAKEAGGEGGEGEAGEKAEEGAGEEGGEEEGEDEAKEGEEGKEEGEEGGEGEGKDGEEGAKEGEESGDGEGKEGEEGGEGEKGEAKEGEEGGEGGEEGEGKEEGEGGEGGKEGEGKEGGEEAAEKGVKGGAMLAAKRGGAGEKRGGGGGRREVKEGWRGKAEADEARLQGVLKRLEEREAKVVVKMYADRLQAAMDPLHP